MPVQSGAVEHRWRAASDRGVFAGRSVGRFVQCRRVGDGEGPEAELGPVAEEGVTIFADTIAIPLGQVEHRLPLETGGKVFQGPHNYGAMAVK